MNIHNIALCVQIAGVSILFLLFVFLSLYDKRLYLRYWMVGWFLYAAALLTLLLSFLHHLHWFLALYQFFELGSLAMLIAAAWNYSREFPIRKYHLLLAIPMAAWAVVLTWALKGFNSIYVIHLFVMAWAFGYNAYLLFSSRWFRFNVGARILAYVCSIFALMDLHYFFVFGYVFHRNLSSLDYLQFSSFYDLLLQYALAIGMVVTAMQETQHRLESANAQLHEAQDRLRYLAQTDSLTGVYNRHAFREFCEVDFKRARTSKFPDALGLLDIDNLKKINDLAGHSRGDDVLRVVARTISSMVRGEDCLVRWGGDEFLVLMRETDLSQAEKRLQLLKEHLSHQSINTRAGKIFFGICYGVAELSSIDRLATAIEEADRQLYHQKQFSKKSLMVV
ncbi:MAG: GGDEF domain-containing protein [Acidobacteriia bacterium]|nr:GGDEF domain-containing protein [Terriglobia bacterium]